MLRRPFLLPAIVFLVLVACFGSVRGIQAGATGQPSLASSPVELVNAVNALRISYGLPPYAISPILMATAQAQADFLALTGTMTHAGPGGIGLTDRLLAAGYPLAGDLSLGGFRSENITGGPESMPAEAAVQRWTGDAPHLTTMISPDLTEIGAGVAVDDGRVYYVIDCALPTTDRLQQPPAASGDGSSPVPPPSPVGIIFPVSMSTPNAQGDLIHEVKPGQSLWQIAIAYDTKIDEIKRLNNLSDNSIFPGEMLVIRTGVFITVTPPTHAATLQITVPGRGLPAATFTVQPATPGVAPTLESSTRQASNATTRRVVLGIVALAIIGGVILAWSGAGKKQ